MDRQDRLDLLARQVQLVRLDLLARPERLDLLARRDQRRRDRRRDRLEVSKYA